METTYGGWSKQATGALVKSSEMALRPRLKVLMLHRCSTLRYTIIKVLNRQGKKKTKNYTSHPYPRSNKSCLSKGKQKSSDKSVATSFELCHSLYNAFCLKQQALCQSVCLCLFDHEIPCYTLSEGCMNLLLVTHIIRLGFALQFSPLIWHYLKAKYPPAEDV